MALRNQPYIPLYVQDFLTDEKLMECSASATGVYIKIMCVMHKSDEYGTILLRQKDKQTTYQIKNFATKLLKHLPFDVEVIEEALLELINEGVLTLNGDKLLQKRMLRDNDISIKRKIAGSKGGFAKANNVAKELANTEYEYENEDINIKEEEKMKIDLEQHLLKWWGHEGRMGWGVLTNFIDLAKKHGEKELLDAIEEAAKHNAKTLKYVIGILEKHGTKKLTESKLKRVGE